MAKDIEIEPKEIFNRLINYGRWLQGDKKLTEDDWITPAKAEQALLEYSQREVGKKLGWWADDIAHCFKPLCSSCKRLATIQTAHGKYAQENHHRPCNWGYYCQKHWDEGVEMEREAIGE